MTEKETVTAREDQLGTCDELKEPHVQYMFCIGWKNLAAPEDQPRPTLPHHVRCKSRAGEPCDCCDAREVMEVTCKSLVETGAHPSQDSRTEFLTGILAKYGVDCGPSIATHGGKLIYGDEFMHAADEIINWARSTPSPDPPKES